MNHVHLEIGEMRLALVNGGADSGRAENIGRLTLEFVRELMEREWQHLGVNAIIDSLEVPPMNISLSALDDEAVARTSAAGIYRALTAVR